MTLAPSFPPLLWAFALLLLSRSGAVVRVAPCLLLLRGPLALVLVGIAVGAALLRAGRRDPAPLRDPGAWPVFLAAAGFFLLVGLWYTSRLRVSGDEPHYLVMARSLWREGDLDLRDNYAREDWREDTLGPVEPHYGAPRRDGRPFPAHSPGLPLLLAPVDAMGGRRACVIVLALLAAWLIVEVRALALRGTGDASAATLAAAVAAGPPLAAYAFHVYTEVPSALAIALALRLMAPAAGLRDAVFGALAAAALPWLHVKMIPAAAALGLVGLLRLRDRARLAFLVTALVMAGAFMSYYAAIFGAASPLAIYGGLPQDATGSPGRATFGLLLDGSSGLLPHAPAFLIALAGLVSLARRPSWSAWPQVLVGAAVLLPVLPWRMWWGGLCPPARFLVPLVPLLALAAAHAARGPVRGLLRWRIALLAAGFGLLDFAAADPGLRLLLSRANRSSRLWAALSGEGDLARYLPSLARPDAAEVKVAALWVIALVALLGLDQLARRRDGVDRWFRGLGLPVVLFLLLGLAVDHWARPARSPQLRATQGATPATREGSVGEAAPQDPPQPVIGPGGLGVPSRLELLPVPRRQGTVAELVVHGVPGILAEGIERPVPAAFLEQVDEVGEVTIGASRPALHSELTHEETSWPQVVLLLPGVDRREEPSKSFPVPAMSGRGVKGVVGNLTGIDEASLVLFAVRIRVGLVHVDGVEHARVVERRELRERPRCRVEAAVEHDGVERVHRAHGTGQSRVESVEVGRAARDALRVGGKVERPVVGGPAGELRIGLVQEVVADEGRVALERRR